MARKYQFVNAILFAGIVLLLFLFVFEDKLQIPIWLQVAGRMHPLFLHFPIVLLILSILPVWVSNTFSDSNFGYYIRLAAASTAIITALMGLILSIEQSDKGDLLNWHKWTGISVALIAWLYYSYYELIKSNKNYHRTFSIAVFLLLILTGHWGSALTHGENYLWEPLQVGKTVTVNEETALVFKEVIQPIFQTKCGNCHMGHNQKGGLSLTDSVSIAKGGKNGKTIELANWQNSLLVERLRLPLMDKKHMPLSDKPQLNEMETKLIERWIMSRTPYNVKLVSLPITDSLRILAFQYLQPYLSAKKEPAYAFAAADEKKITALNNNYRIVKPLGLHSPALSVSFFGKAQYSFDKLKELESIQKQILHLNVSKMPVTDEQLDFIAGFPNLERLNLNYTEITDNGLQKLSEIKNLHSIALIGTKISKTGLESLLKNKSITELFVWDTKIAEADITAIKKTHQNLTIDLGFTGADTTLLTLNTALVKTPTGFFNEKKAIELGHVLKDVTIKYTLDGSEPDSFHGLIYKAPILIDSSAEIQFKAFKKGWLPSKLSKASFIKAGIPIAKTVLVTPADPKYNAQSEKVLTDLDLGDISDFSSKSLGYQKNDAVIIFDLGKTQTIQRVDVHTLQNIASYIFPPTKLEILGSMDNIHWQTLKSLSLPLPTKILPAEIKTYHLLFKNTSVRYIKLIGAPIKKLPIWHPGKGQPGWLFLSELTVY